MRPQKTVKGIEGEEKEKEKAKGKKVKRKRTGKRRDNTWEKVLLSASGICFPNLGCFSPSACVVSRREVPLRASDPFPSRRTVRLRQTSLSVYLMYLLCIPTSTLSVSGHVGHVGWRGILYLLLSLNSCICSSLVKVYIVYFCTSQKVVVC